MTLTEFLLARIAEDEEGPFFNAWHVGRIRAECEAKRQRVPVLAEMEADPDNRLSSYAYALLCREALPYADHPDYQEAWAL